MSTMQVNSPRFEAVDRMREIIDSAPSPGADRRSIVKNSPSIKGFVPTEAHVKMYSTLGTRWVGHPNYSPLARHSHNPDIYMPARRAFLEEIAARAQLDRERNPAFIRAEQIRRVI